MKLQRNLVPEARQVNSLDCELIGLGYDMAQPTILAVRALIPVAQSGEVSKVEFALMFSREDAIELHAALGCQLRDGSSN